MIDHHDPRIRKLLQQKSTADPDNHLRVGQYFVNKYVKGPWPELFHSNDTKAIPMIIQYLDNLQYTDTLPRAL